MASTKIPGLTRAQLSEFVKDPRTLVAMERLISISTEAFDFGVPSGAILMWSGATDQIPANWALCDGTNGTPNLTDRFVISAGEGTYSVGATGGSEEKTTSEVADHDHNYSGVTDSAGGGEIHAVGLQDATGSHDHNYSGVTDSAGGHSHDVNVMPPYYALAFIMRL